MNLEDFYKVNKVPDEDRITMEKNILLVVPEREFDTAPILERMGLSKYEVAVTWPKKTVEMLPEICVIKAGFVLQVGRRFFKKFAFSPADGDWDSRFEDKLQMAVADMFSIRAVPPSHG